jgi:6-carboxyhexanoate--CoA ligase
MWSVRMRASKIENEIEKHISGAEGIYNLAETQKALKQFFKRAIEHPNGLPDRIILTIEQIKEPINKIKSLPIKTLFFKSSEEALKTVKDKLIQLGISEKAILSALDVIKNNKMRGATLIDSITGNRLEPNKQRGVRVSRIQMDKKTKFKILRKIKNLSSDPQRVIEAVTIASKVSSANGIIAEICISDNPDYTTGYLSSKNLGYLRITNIKKEGETFGGRAFFIKTPVDLEKIINFLERTPVIVI